jgi:hypothetical protein
MKGRCQRWGWGARANRKPQVDVGDTDDRGASTGRRREDGDEGARTDFARAALGIMATGPAKPIHWKPFLGDHGIHFAAVDAAAAAGVEARFREHLRAEPPRF